MGRITGCSEERGEVEGTGGDGSVRVCWVRGMKRRQR